MRSRVAVGWKSYILHIGYQVPASANAVLRRAFRAAGGETFVGKPPVLARYVRTIRHQPTLPEALACLEARLGTSLAQAHDDPLFIFAAGWRSGSTLLQRLVVSSGRYELWGEPFSRTDSVRRLADSLLPFGTGWPPEQYLWTRHGRAAELANSWIANMYPPLPSLVEAHREYWRTAYQTVAAGDQQWGFKEVRLSINYAHYLRFIFPQARFLFIVRNPYDAYASYMPWSSWYDRWPRHQVRSPQAFARVWRRLAPGFADGADGIGGLLVRYEDLPRPETLDQIEAYLGVSIDRSVLTRRRRGRESSAVHRLSRAQRLALQMVLAGRERRLGYQPR